MNRATTWLAAHRHRLGTMAIGHAANQAQVVLFDYLLYPAMIAWLGPLSGGAIMTASSALFCWLLIVLYRWSGRDWLGLELVRDLRDGPEPRNALLRWTRASLRRGKLVALLVLSVRFDPFITTLYLREGPAGRGGLSAQDWRVFWASVVISNLYWIGALTILIELARGLWPYLGG